MNNSLKSSNAVILGAGLTGLTAAYFLKRLNRPVIVLERDREIGGLAKTRHYKGFRFDLGGHRFTTNNRELEIFVKQLLANRYRIVSRSSKIYFNRRLINYPIELVDIVRHFSLWQIGSILIDYCAQKCRLWPVETKSLESWVIDRFGVKLYTIFFKQYSEKVWGIPCHSIDSDWIAQRIQGLDLLQAAKHAIYASSGKKYSTLADKFLYPDDGIYQIAESLSLHLDPNSIKRDSTIVSIYHSDGVINRIDYTNGGRLHKIETESIISTIPIATFIKLLRPSPPADVLKAANCLRSRDLVLVVVMINMECVNKENWIYFPLHDVPFGRIHEPKNWSPNMAPQGKTSLVVEYFCNCCDSTWSSNDDDLIRDTVANLDSIGIVSSSKVFDGVVYRVKNAYPLFDLDYRENSKLIKSYIDRFNNTILAGRTGAFQYSNMDQCMLDGLNSAEKVLGKKLTKYMNLSTSFAEEEYRDEMCATHSRLATR